ncbi:MAG: Rho termination factor N-terminal domain-containing protein [Actinobacteria bacterium]|nr:Rho termination factor N-terminal domain-containing protein [Actinomycetota bacterium]
MKFNCETYPALVVWDPAANKAAAEFKDGLLETEDENVIALVKKISEETGITEVKGGQRKQLEAAADEQMAGDREDAPKVEEEPAPKPKEDTSPSMNELRVRAKELGITSFGMSKGALMEAISKKEAAADEHGDS